MKKRLLITGSTFPRYENDTEPRFILDLAKYMKEYAEVTVLVPAAPKAADTEVLEGVSDKVPLFSGSFIRNIMLSRSNRTQNQRKESQGPSGSLAFCVIMGASF